MFSCPRPFGFMPRSAATNGAPQHDIRISTLGTLQVVRDQQAVSEGDWHTRQARQVLKILITERPRPVATDRLIELLWPQSSPSAAATTLRSAINALRNVLEPERRNRAPSIYIVTETPGYAFRPDSTLWLDVDIFEQKLNQAETSTDAVERQRLLEEAIALYQDDYLISDPYADWAQNERERLRERYFTALLQFAEIQADLGNLNAALAACRRILARDEVRENAYQALMRYQAEAGDSAGALLTYERCRIVLAEELGADPSPLTQRWHQRILNGEVQPRALTAVPSPAPATVTLSRVATPPQPRVPALLPQQTVLPVFDAYFADLFAGRQNELEKAAARLQRALSSHGNLTLLAGETGAGKTRLAYELLKIAGEACATVLSAACQPSERQLPFAPLADSLSRYLHGLPDDVLASLPSSSLAQVAQIVPSLADRLPDLPLSPHEAPVRSDENRQRLVAGIAALLAALASRRPLVFFIDDLHWADAGTLAVLSRLAARLDEMPLAVLLAYRSDDLSENEALATLLHALKRERRHQVIGVERLTAAEVAQLVAAVTGAENQTLTSLAGALHRATGGNALFVTETLRDWQERHQSSTKGGELLDEGSPLLRPSQRVQEIISERIGRLAEPAQRVLQLSAVIARDFSLDLLENATPTDPMTGLEILLRRQFLVERPDERLEFSHQVVRQVAYETMPALQRRRLHRQVADALVALGRGYDSPAEIAFHYGQAGAASQPAFVEYSVLAGEKSLLAYGFQPAVVYFDQALAVLEKRPDDEAVWVARALQGRGRAYESLFDPTGVTDTYQRLRQWGQRQGDRLLMLTAYSRLASMLGLLGQQGESNKLLRELMTTLAEGGRAEERSQVIEDLYQRRRRIYSADPPETAPTWSAYSPPPPTVADPLADILQTLDRVHAVLPLLDYGWTLLVQGQLTEATHCLEAVVELANETGQASIAATAYYQLAVAARILGHWEQSHALNERSILLNRAIQGMAAERASLWPRIGSAFLSLKQERIDEAERRLQRALALLDQRPAFRNHRNSAEIGLGLVALYRGDDARAQRLLEEALADAVNLYPYTHVQALLGLARLAHLRQDADHAAALLRQALRFAGHRSLLEEYIDTLLVIAELQPAGAPIEQLLETTLRQVQAMGLDAAGAELSAALARFPA
ncbi:MAG: hypothetical protein DCC55_22355 [Chloroflexi bacterium]|nr:MAG: hypothetical protein DCC55_22355 [Chloroflexota bacterium]